MTPLAVSEIVCTTKDFNVQRKTVITVSLRPTSSSFKRFNSTTWRFRYVVRSVWHIFSTDMCCVAVVFYFTMCSSLKKFLLQHKGRFRLNFLFHTFLYFFNMYIYVSEILRVLIWAPPGYNLFRSFRLDFFFVLFNTLLYPNLNTLYYLNIINPCRNLLLFIKYSTTLRYI